MTVYCRVGPAMSKPFRGPRNSVVVGRSSIGRSSLSVVDRARRGSIGRSADRLAINRPVVDLSSVVCHAPRSWVGPYRRSRTLRRLLLAPYCRQPIAGRVVLAAYQCSGRRLPSDRRLLTADCSPPTDHRRLLTARYWPPCATPTADRLLLDIYDCYRPPTLGRAVRTAHYWPAMVGHLLLTADYRPPTICGLLLVAYWLPPPAGRLLLAAYCPPKMCCHPRAARDWPRTIGLPLSAYRWPPTDRRLLAGYHWPPATTGRRLFAADVLAADYSPPIVGCPLLVAYAVAAVSSSLCVAVELGPPFVCERLRAIVVERAPLPRRRGPARSRAS